LFRGLAVFAQSIVGVDNSPIVPSSGLVTEFGLIERAEVSEVTAERFPDIEVVIAGELIEHIVDAPNLITRVLGEFPNSRVLFTTPNSTGITNVLLALVNRESQHRDHVCIYSYRTLVRFSGLSSTHELQLRPYRVSYPEYKSSSTRATRRLVSSLEKFLHLIERIWPLYSAGWILDFEPIRSQETSP